MAQLAIIQWPMRIRVGNQSFNIQVDLGWMKIPAGITVEEYVREWRQKNPRRFESLVEEALAAAVVEQYRQERKARKAEEKDKTTRSLKEERESPAQDASGE